MVMLVPALTARHPMDHWPGFQPMTDWEVFLEILARKPSAMAWIGISGVLAFAYNYLQYSIVHKLSATFASFAGNFNKAAIVALSLVFGLESVPPGGYGKLFVVGVVGNILAF